MYYYYLQPTPLMVQIYWGLAFMSLNLYWIIRLLLERRPVRLTEEEQRLYQLVFRTLTPREMLQLLKFAKWEDKETGEILEKQGEAQERLSVIVTGRGSVHMHGKKVSEIREGQFVGKIAFETDEVAPITIVAMEPVRQVSWHKDDLKKFLKNKTELLAALQLILGVDLTVRLEDAWKHAAAGHSRS